MTQIRAVRALSDPIAKAYESLLPALGTERFAVTVRDTLMRLAAGIRGVYLYELAPQGGQFVHCHTGGPETEAQFVTYCRQNLQVAPCAGELVILRVQAADIAAPDVRARFFDAAGTGERIAIVQPGGGGWRGLTLARHASRGRFGDAEVTAVLGIAALLLPMLPTGRTRQAPKGAPALNEIEDRLAKQSPALTPRERQVCARAAMGMTVDASAADLGIGRTSVLTYRQRAYRRLGVRSPAELAALVSR